MVEASKTSEIKGKEERSLLTHYLTLHPDAPIDLHMHTTFSDGRWPAEQLIDFLATEGFALVAVTDHDRVDKVAEIQQLGAARNLTVLSGVEISTYWKGKPTDVLCYGFDPTQNELAPLTERLSRQKTENALEVYEELLRQGYRFPRQEDVLASKGGKVQRAFDNIDLLREHGYIKGWSDGHIILEKAGYRSIRPEMDETVEAAHKSNALCLIAHPGRRENGFTYYTPALLDELLAEIPMDGIELIHPYHSPEDIEMYREYAAQHNLLVSTGSDSHSHPGRMPLKHRAEISRRLLERLGIAISA
ncbi:PHP domain-containing protein [Thermosporothrix hazakensis]|jgi:predicted metal-dependent phosphoesterase TrpH|uniref:PHP domain-containing protein n=1 Tax=Thermosporothrix hazakensis TaxID=644383 RepID=UPI0020138914|nr:PHP domain-containing protein [Thermosporothrix hazakensis]